MSRLLITGSRAHQWTPYDSHALLIAVREILEKAHDPGDTLIPKIAMGVYYFEHPILH